MASLEEFFVAPSVEVLNRLTKDQLRQVCEHYNFDLGLPRTAKLAQIKVLVQAELVVRNILSSPASLYGGVRARRSNVDTSFDRIFQNVTYV